MTLPRAFVRVFLAAALSLLALLLPLRAALASDYTDLWVTAGEDAWGVNFVQWGSVIFATFYIYDINKKPVWYTAVLNWDGASKYTGTLFSTQGTYFLLPWVPGDIVDQPAGTATFQPSTSNNYQGSLVYTVTTVGTVTKAIQRLTVAVIPLGGLYFGGQVGEYSGCTDNTLNSAYRDAFSLQVTQSAGNAVSLGFAYGDTGNLICTFAGTLSQNGLLYRIDGASYLCSDQTDSTAAVTDLKVTAQGIEGHYSAPVPLRGAGCREDARFSAVHN